MPYIYPPAPGVLAGDQITISRFLQNPTLVQRALRTLAQQRFISDVLLPGRIQATGGAVLFETSEPIYANRAPQGVSPGANFPETGIPTGVATTANITKWGLAAPITDEAITRLNFQAVARAMLKVVNQMVRSIDGVFLAAIGASVTQSVAAAAAWSAGTPNILLDVQLAKAAIIGLNMGYDPDTIVLNDDRYARLTADQKVISGLTREAVTSPTATGTIPVIAGLRVLASPNLPTGINAMVMDSQALGSIAYERIESPGYAGDPANGIETKLIREDENDQWLIQARRPVVPAVQEPGAACIISGA